MNKLTALLLLIPVVASAVDGNARLGKYSCVVEAAFPNSGLSESYVGSRLEYDANKGLLQLAVKMEVDGKFVWLPPQTICSNLVVDAYPSHGNSLHAVQFDRQSKSDFRPFVAWLKIKEVDDQVTSNFKFFSTGIEGVVTGTCTHIP